MASIINSTTTAGVTVTGDNSGSLQLATNNGTTAVTIDTSQNVGIGTSSPLAKLDVVSSSGTYRNRMRNSSVSESFLLFQNSASGTNDNNGLLTGIGSDGVAYLYNYQNTALLFATNGSERMRISSAGYVTMPNQPAFHAVRDAGNVSSTGIFICNAVTYNDGSNYNSSTGRFTAPVAGRYQFNFFVLAQSGNSFDFFIRVNGSLYPGMDIRCNTATSGNFTLSCSVVLKLSANDIVDPFIQFLGSGPIYGSGLNGFSMYFLG